MPAELSAPSPDQRCSILPVPGSSVAIALLPPTKLAKEYFPVRLPGEPRGGCFHIFREIFRLATVAANGEDVAAGQPFVAHDAFDEGDSFAVGRPDGIGDLQLRLIDGFHPAGGGVQRG